MDARGWLAVALALTVVLVEFPAPVVQAQGSGPPAVSEETAKPGAGYVVGAVAVNVIYVPAKAASCVLAGASALAMFGITLGFAHRDAVLIAKEGCGRLWVVTPRDLKEGG